MQPRLKIGVLYSRVRVEEKLLFEAFERRGDLAPAYALGADVRESVAHLLSLA